MLFVLRPTYEELIDLVAQLREENKQLKKRVEQLEERLGLNSDNSSKPPSTDRKKNKQTPKGGAKKGHPGHHRKLYSEDQVSKKVISTLTQCEYCGCEQLEKKSPQAFLLSRAFCPIRLDQFTETILRYRQPKSYASPLRQSFVIL